MIDERDGDFLEQNVKGLMMTLIGRWNAQMDEARAATEFASVRPSDIRVFAQLRGQDVKLSKIHLQMGFSRQAAQQAVERLVGQGMLNVTAVQGSKRDKIVSITKKGHRWRAIAADQIRLIEKQCAQVIGDDGTEDLRRYLAKIAKS